VSGHWFWAGLFLLGAYHGLNPAMGWLFAVALGLQERSDRAVLRSLLPLGAGHLISVAVVVLAVQLILFRLPLFALRMAGGGALIAFGLYRMIVTSHPRWVGMRVNARDLAVWSFLMASAHGAGLMLLPFLLNSAGAAGPNGHHQHLLELSSVTEAASVGPFHAWLVVAWHTLGYLSVTALLAILVYRKFGVAFLHRGWVNLDWLWAAALVAAGLVTLWF
jgi:hypothetical protein